MFTHYFWIEKRHGYFRKMFGPLFNYIKETGGEIFLPNPDVPGEYVDFEARLEDVDGQYVLKGVMDDGLAYSAGFR